MVSFFFKAVVQYLLTICQVQFQCKYWNNLVYKDKVFWGRHVSPAFFYSFKYSKSRQTGSGHAADSTCVTRYSSPYWCSVPNIKKLASVFPEKNVTKIILWANLPMSTIFKVASNRKWTCRRFKTALHDTVLHTDALCQISGSWPVWFHRKMWQKFFVMPTTTTQDDRSDPYMSLLLKRAGDTKTFIFHLLCVHRSHCARVCAPSRSAFAQQSHIVQQLAFSVQTSFTLRFFSVHSPFIQGSLMVLVGK